MTEPLRPLVAVYADESCLGNGQEGENPGGAGGLLEHIPSDASRLVRRDFWVSEPATTNNRMALRSAIAAGELLSGKSQSCDIVFTSDSQYLIRGMTEWVHGWAARGWRRKSGPIENLELWWSAIAAMRLHRVRWEWVRGHAGHPQNEYANLLATRAAADQSDSSGLVASRFPEWLATERQHGRQTRPPLHPPAQAAFHPHPPLPPPGEMRYHFPFSP